MVLCSFCGGVSFKFKMGITTTLYRETCPSMFCPRALFFPMYDNCGDALPHFIGSLNLNTEPMVFVCVSGSLLLSNANRGYDQPLD